MLFLFFSQFLSQFLSRFVSQFFYKVILIQLNTKVSDIWIFFLSYLSLLLESRATISNFLTGTVATSNSPPPLLALSLTLLSLANLVHSF